jgi:hypothetical protein
MNGRVEDAILGRFLSPDPHIPDPTSAQSYNRYSYVNNNPLTMVDPTGFINKYPSFGGGGGGFIWGATDVSFDSGLTFNAVNGDGGSPFWGQPTTTSSTNPITAFDQWMSAATGSAAQSLGQAQSQGTSPDPGAVQSILGPESAPLAGGGILGDIIGAIAEVLGISAAVSAPPSPTATLQLAQQIQGNVPLSAQTVVILETNGPTIVTASGSGLTAQQVATATQLGLTPGVSLGEGFHAEDAAIISAGELGATPTTGVSTNPICASCASMMSEAASAGGLTLIISNGGKSFSFVPAFGSPSLFPPP